ncbi:MAG: magnesium transporter CorA family protein [Bryobacteraceae bacterium]|nr:magnesium transporter CorA family protein [Bryobacteraceae bacterium]
MIWHDLRDPNDPKLDELAEKYQIHPLHIEDCRHRKQNAKIEFTSNYVFSVIKPVQIQQECIIEASDLDVFVGPDYIITVQESECQPVSDFLSSLHGAELKSSSGELFHKIFDGVVDLYNPVADTLSERIDVLERQALQTPQSATIEALFELRRALIELRRILANSRDVLGHLLRTEHAFLPTSLYPFWRDVYDHVARALDVVEVQRDLVTGATELYLTSVANQTNQVMKVLTVFGTVATPALIITGLYGMNVSNLPYAESPHAWGIVMTIIAVVSGLMLLLFRIMRWL